MDCTGLSNDRRLKSNNLKQIVHGNIILKYVWNFSSRFLLILPYSLIFLTNINLFAWKFLYTRDVYKHICITPYIFMQFTFITVPCDFRWHFFKRNTHTHIKNCNWRRQGNFLEKMLFRNTWPLRQTFDVPIETFDRYCITSYSQLFVSIRARISLINICSLLVLVASLLFDDFSCWRTFVRSSPSLNLLVMNIKALCAFQVK